MNQTVKFARGRCNRFFGKRCYTYTHAGIFKHSPIRAGVVLVRSAE